MIPLIEHSRIGKARETVALEIRKISLRMGT